MHRPLSTIAFIVIMLMASAAIAVAGWQAAGDAAVASSFSEQEVADALRIHNAARKEVTLPPLTWARPLAGFAQQWANRLADTGELEHRSNIAYGESLAINETVVKGMESWSGEKSAYKSGTPLTESNLDAVGHYTQMVWKATTSVGCGRAVVRRGPYMGFIVLVCNYDPPGNVTGERPF